MRSFQIDDNNDFAVSRGGSLIVAEGVAAIADVCKNAIQDQLGEMIFRMAEGMPTQATAFDTYNPSQFEASARVTLKAVPGVREILSFSVSRVGDVLRYSALIETDLGSVALNG